jgi:AAA15 family ATPase/GTPase
LRKVCFIGQNATGKTSILEMLKDSTKSISKIELIDNYYWCSDPIEFNASIEFESNGDILLLQKDGIIINGRELKKLHLEGIGGKNNSVWSEIRLLYLSSEIISKEIINVLDKNPIDILSLMSDERSLDTYVSTPSQYSYEFTQEFNKDLWFTLLKQILEYRKRFTQFVAELLSKGTVGDLTKMNKEYSLWAAENENPLNLFAEHINPILSKLNLEIDLINTEYSVPIKSKGDDSVIPITGLSTGTKGLLLSLFPVSQLKTDNSIIILDEPERSLFPDVQVELISYYEQLATNAQIFVATHSPFIAAAFEPEERFILYFDNNGKVAFRRGESPIGDDPNDMLRNDFRVDYYNKFGKEAYHNYLDLKRKMVQETNPEIKKALLAELSNLGDKYNFDEEGN